MVRRTFGGFVPWAPLEVPTSEGRNIAWKQEQRISFKTLWFGTLFGASFSGAPAVFAAICNGIAVFCAVLCGAERLSGGS